VAPEGAFAFLSVGGRRLQLGRWATKREAAVARDRAALNFGLDARLNFPRASRALGPASPEELRRIAHSRRGRKDRGCPYIGVKRAQASGWNAALNVNGTRYHLGRLPTQKLAALWRDRAALYYGASSLVRNFPDQKVSPASAEELREEARLMIRERVGTAGVPGSRYGGVEVIQEQFAAVVRIDGRPVRAGTYATEREAAIARDRAVLHLGSGDELNFPAAARLLGPASPIELRREARSRSKTRKGSSPYVGVRWVPKAKKWLARATVDGKARTLGYYEHARDAAIARERVIAYYGDPLVVRNFPKTHFEPISFEDLRVERRRVRRQRASSRYFGVTRRDRIERPWQAIWKGIGEIGAWATEREAAEAFDRALLHYGGPTRLLNFPKQRLSPADAVTLRAEARQRYKERTTSRFRGVVWAKDRDAWVASIRHDGAKERIGDFDTEEAAARAYDRRALEVRREGALLNFHPVTGEELRSFTRLEDLEGGRDLCRRILGDESVSSEDDQKQRNRPGSAHRRHP
jgi:hypothetical protein